MYDGVMAMWPSGAAPAGPHAHIPPGLPQCWQLPAPTWGRSAPPTRRSPDDAPVGVSLASGSALERLASVCRMDSVLLTNAVLRVYRGRRPENTNQRLRVAARRSQPPQGLTPNVYVIRLMMSPRPTSSLLMNPGRRTR